MSFAIELDFDRRSDRQIDITQASASCAAGLFVWVDIDASADRPAAEDLLRQLGVNQHAIDEALGTDVDGRYDLYDDCLHIALTGCRLVGGHVDTSHVDILIGEHFMVTLRRGEVDFVEQVKRHYRKDFQRFAKTPGFLIYEYWDYLIEGYKKTMQQFEVEVARLQKHIFEVVDDSIFSDVAAVTSELMRLRKVMLAAREVLHELSTRKVIFVSETTQPFLQSMAGTIERLAGDLAIERDILTESLNLYMGIVSHRTNRIVSRLTVVSVIFLPLTFLCGVYGMNFDFDGERRNPLMPELTWEYGYPMFWATAALIAGGLLAFMKWKRWW